MFVGVPGVGSALGPWAASEHEPHLPAEEALQAARGIWERIQWEQVARSPLSGASLRRVWQSLCQMLGARIAGCGPPTTSTTYGRWDRCPRGDGPGLAPGTHARSERPAAPYSGLYLNEIPRRTR
jgi:hypothetical protein